MHYFRVVHELFRDVFFFSAFSVFRGYQDLMGNTGFPRTREGGISIPASLA